jgi:hypothetical protein
MIYVMGIDMALAAAFWLTLAAGCFLLYHAFRLQVLPWIGAYFVVSYVSANVMYVYFLRLGVSSGTPPDPHSGVTVAATVATMIEHSANLLAAVLALAEVAVLGGRGQADIMGGAGLRWLVRVHAYTRALGITLLILALALPLPAIICYYTH